MLENRKSLVIVARSSRALAQSARRGGWLPLVADAFADVDTKAAAHRTVQVAMEKGGLNERQLPGALSGLPDDDVGLVYGAGLEAQPRLLERLSERYRIIGNAPEIVRSVKDPRTFFQTLSALKIPFPETRFESPKNRNGLWLTKHALGAGGGHIQLWNHGSVAEHQHYFQRYLPGPAVSALFVADGRRAQIIGYNTQWQCAAGAQSFAYAGAVNRACLIAAQRRIIARHVKALTRVFGLRGLNSLDFILCHRTALVLEINPRPTATCELYEPDTRDGMVAAHVRACSGELEQPSTARRFKVRAHAIVYAQRPCHIPMNMQWPRWCRDLPRGGSDFAVGEPVCSVHAEGKDVTAVQQLIRTLRQSVLVSFNPRPLAA
jgi:uncharacterized protein